MNNIPIVFLDFDGVLNDEDYCQKNWPLAPKEDGLLTALVLCPIRIERVNRLLAATGAKVVLSTSWRIYAHDAEGKVRSRGLVADILGHTPRMSGIKNDGERYSRADEIHAWRTQNRHTGPFVVLDDEDRATIEGHTVLTSACTGITDADVERAIAILRMNNGAVDLFAVGQRLQTVAVADWHKHMTADEAKALLECPGDLLEVLEASRGAAVFHEQREEAIRIGGGMRIMLSPSNLVITREWDDFVARVRGDG